MINRLITNCVCLVKLFVHQNKHVSDDVAVEDNYPQQELAYFFFFGLELYYSACPFI